MSNILEKLQKISKNTTLISDWGIINSLKGGAVSEAPTETDDISEAITVKQEEISDADTLSWNYPTQAIRTTDTLDSIYDNDISTQKRVKQKSTEKTDITITTEDYTLGIPDDESSSIDFE